MFGPILYTLHSTIGIRRIVVTYSPEATYVFLAKWCETETDHLFFFSFFFPSIWPTANYSVATYLVSFDPGKT